MGRVGTASRHSRIHSQVAGGGPGWQVAGWDDGPLKGEPDDRLVTLYPKHPLRFPVFVFLSANGRDVIASLPLPSCFARYSFDVGGELVAYARHVRDLLGGGLAELLDAAECLQEGVAALRPEARHFVED